ncbi:MAG TPA: translation initiation factor IF-2 N-terminal domain-containing protein, partial [Deltaproteobacteria bacterium]|nr:translation initiation factor IF-2 N-terminal domain-containing protein [Deltaproteobacteria bacterium]
MTRKMRVFELAKELSLDPKDLLRIAKDLAISVDTAMSVIDGHDVERIKKRLERETQKKEEEETRVQEVYEEKRVSTTVIR